MDRLPYPDFLDTDLLPQQENVDEVLWAMRQPVPVAAAKRADGAGAGEGGVERAEAAQHGIAARGWRRHQGDGGSGEGGDGGLAGRGRGSGHGLTGRKQVRGLDLMTGRRLLASGGGGSSSEGRDEDARTEEDRVGFDDSEDNRRLSSSSSSSSSSLGGPSALQEEPRGDSGPSSLPTRASLGQSGTSGRRELPYLSSPGAPRRSVGRGSTGLAGSDAGAPLLRSLRRTATRSDTEPDTGSGAGSSDRDKGRVGRDLADRRSFYGRSYSDVEDSLYGGRDRSGGLGYDDERNRGVTDTASGLSDRGSSLFLDVGANVGWFTINVAARGYEVAAFEGRCRGKSVGRLGCGSDLPRSLLFAA